MISLLEILNELEINKPVNSFKVTPKGHLHLQYRTQLENILDKIFANRKQSTLDYFENESEFFILDTFWIFNSKYGENFINTDGFTKYEDFLTNYNKSWDDNIIVANNYLKSFIEAGYITKFNLPK